jgi:cytidylate kinase
MRRTPAETPLPLRRAEDAVVVESDGKTVDQVTEEIAHIAERAWAA